MTIKPIIAASILAASLSCSALAGDKPTINVTPVAQDPDAANGGIVYALPQTVIQIQLTAQVVVSTTGPYYQYSTRYLNLTDVVTENSTKWQLLNANVSTIGKVDFSRRYKISTTDNTTLPAISLTTDGILSSLNAPATPPPPHPHNPAPQTPQYYSFANVPLSQNVLARTSKAAMAEECALSIYSLRAARLALISATPDNRLPDAGSLAQALHNINQLEKQHLELFTGHRDTLIVTKIIEIMPDYNGANSTVPIRFSESAGFLDAMDLSGKPIYVDLEFDDSAKLNELPKTSKQRSNEPLNGLFYIIPGNVTVKVLDRNIPLAQVKIRCTQNGQVACLPASQILSNIISLDNATGAIISLSPISR